MREDKEDLNNTYPHTQNQPEEEEKAKKRAESFETALNFFESQLWEARGRQALNYLTRRRGCTKEEIEAMELGFFPFEKRARKHLGDFFDSLGLNVKGFGVTHKLVIPYRDCEGTLKGFIVRRLDSGKSKYIYTRGTERDTLFNFNEARGRKHIIVVEGYFDALIATQRGIKGVVAIGRPRLTEKMLEDIIRYGVKSITLIPDNDEIGLKGAEKSLKLIVEKGLNALVLELPGEFKDLDEFIRKQGIKSFDKLKKQVKSGDKWDVKKSLSEHGNIKVQIRNVDNTSTARTYYIRRGNETGKKENNS